MTTPIITSLLDTDVYKLNMQQAVFHLYPEVPVEAEFHCRSSEDLRYLIPALKEQVAMMAELSFSPDELAYLSDLGLYQQDYLDWLKTFQLNADQVEIKEQDSQLAIRISGLWRDVILWEVPLLAIICELRCHNMYPESTAAQAVDRLQYKIEKLFASGDDLSQFSVIDFGTRRRFSKEVHWSIVDHLRQHFPHFIGTSNLELAKEFGLQPFGTQAHEWFQAHQQLSGELADSQLLALNRWLQAYPDKLGIALTDCINMDAFLRDFGTHLSETFSGLRHDSGDPISWGERAIEHYRSQDIDPMEKMLVFSDSLTLEKAAAIYSHFSGRINTSFGIGTQLTCNLPDVKTLNIVLKLVSCNGKPVAKISDEPDKSICRDEQYLSELRQAFNIA